MTRELCCQTIEILMIKGLSQAGGPRTGTRTHADDHWEKEIMVNGDNGVFELS